MSIAERLVTVIVLVLVGMGASLLIDPPVVWIVGLLLTVVTCVGTDQIVHAHWHVHLRRKRYVATIWILPGLLVAGSFLFLRMLVVSVPPASRGFTAVAGLVVVGALMAGVIVGQYRTLDRDDPWYSRARFALNLTAYLTAFALYSAIYSTKLRSIFSATAILLISGLVCLELFRESEGRVGRTWLYSAAVGLAVGEVTWALNYWTISPLAAGAAMLICLYVLSGIIQHFLRGRLERRTLLEFGGITLLGFGLLLVSGLSG